jgi:hypothetical protein
MNKFSPEHYENFCNEEAAAVNNLKSKIESIQTGCRILVYNPSTRRDEWHTVQTVEAREDLSLARIITTNFKLFWANEVKLVHNAAQTETLMICLNGRERELLEATKRADISDLKVFPDFEFDSFVVVNLENNHEYKVSLKVIRGKVIASCEESGGELCRDFKFRGRICKHLAKVLRDCELAYLAKLAREINTKTVAAV